MAHKIIGIDLGSYSLKLAVASTGFRGAVITDWLSYPIPPGEEPYEERAARILAEVMKKRGLHNDVPYTALPGDAVSMRVLDFEFAGLKRTDLDKAVGAELESQLPHDLDDMVYAFETMPKIVESGNATVPDEPLPNGKRREAVIAASPGTRVLAAAATRDRVTRLLDLAAQHRYEAPHGVVAAPCAYVKVAEKLGALFGAEAHEGQMIIDHGHTRTNICIVRQGKAVFARTLSRGGRHVTQAIAHAWPHLSFDDAEHAKHNEGFIASAREPAASEQWARISEVLKHELLTLVRDLRQTVAACRAQTGVVIARAVLCGGGGRLKGLPSFLSEELGVPVGIVDASDADRLLGPQLAAKGSVPIDLAILSIAITGMGGGKAPFDLRQGPLAYKADYSFLRARAGYLVACALLLVAFGVGSAFASSYKLRTEARILDKQLEDATTEVFGKPMSLDDLLTKLSPKKEDSPLPKMTAFDLIVDISKHLPARTEGKLDVLELDVEPKKVTMRAVADSSKTIDAIAKKLKEIDCFTDIQNPRAEAVSDGQSFSFTIQSKCM